MAAGRIITPAYMPALDSDGEPISGALLYTYANNTTTPLATYTDASLTVAHANPVVADASGVFASIFADDVQLYSITVTTATGAPLASYDNVRASSLLNSANAPTPEDFGAVGDGTTNDSAALISWFAYCVANDLIGYGKRNYKASSNVTSMLAARWPEGPGGIVTAAGRTYHFTPNGVTDINILYVSFTAGLATNDGLTTSAPTTLAQAFDFKSRLKERGLDGRWQIQFINSSTNGGIALADLPYFTNYLELYGDEANIAAWASGQTIAQFDKRSSKSGQIVWIACTSGTTGATEPYGRCSPGAPANPYFDDGGVIWRWVGGDETWATGQTVVAGETVRKYGANLYLATTSGTTGATPPTHTTKTAAVSDGAVSWFYRGAALTPPSKYSRTVFDGGLNPPQWVAGRTVKYGDARYYGTHCYRSEGVGTTGATPPTHISGKASDGTITWRYIGERDTTVSLYAFDANPAPRMAFIGIEFRGFQNTELTDDGTGARFQGASSFLMQRCWNLNNINGAVFVNGCEGTVTNTVFFNCGHGADFRYHTNVNIGGNSAATACFVLGSDTGSYIARESVMHTDYTQWDGCSTGIVHQIASRSRSSGSHFLRCARGIWNIDASQWENTSAELWLGSAYANTIAQSYDGYSRGNYHREGTQGTLRYDKDFTPVTLNGTAALQTVKTLSKTLPGDWFIDNDKELRVVVRGTKTGTAGTYDVRVSLDGNIISGPSGVTAAQSGDFELVLDCVATGNATQIASYEHKINGQTYRRLNDAARAITMVDSVGVVSNRAIQVQVAVAGAGDSVTITSVRAYITG